MEVEGGGDAVSGRGGGRRREEKGGDGGNRRRWEGGGEGRTCWEEEIEGLEGAGVRKLGSIQISETGYQTAGKRVTNGVTDLVVTLSFLCAHVCLCACVCVFVRACVYCVF